MATLPDWIECRKIYAKDNNVYAEIRLKYIPLRFLLDVIKKSIGWRIWQYPKIIKRCLDRIGVVSQPYKKFTGFHNE